MQKYYNISKQRLVSDFNLDIIQDLILSREDRITLYAEVMPFEKVELHVISGTLSLLGFADTPTIMFSDVLNATDKNNKYGEVAGKDEYFQNILHRFSDLSNEVNETFPIIVNNKRTWIRLHIVPNKKNPKISTLFITDVSKYIIREEEMYEKTHKDPLTNLFNNYTLNFHYGDRYLDDDFHVLFLDLDNFKLVNDVYGHNVGNEYLKEFAKVLKSFEDNKNLFYRNGGDEFIGLFFAPEEKIRKIADGILKATKEIQIEGTDHRISTSIGIVKATIREDVIRKADKVLYKAKESGKNKYLYEIEK